MLAILNEEIRSADPSATLPDHDRLVRIGRAGTLDSPEARALLAELEIAATKAGLAFPPSLKAVSNAAP